VSEIRGVIFDLGSTLLRFDGDWNAIILDGRRAMVESLLSMGVPIDGLDFAAAFQREMEASLRERQEDYVERPAGTVLRNVLQQAGISAVSDDLIRRALQEMFVITEAHWVLMPDAHSVLQELQRRSLQLGMISNASDKDDVNRLIDAADLRDYFNPILISAEFGRRKPDPSLFNAVLQAWSLPPDEVVMIGDTLSHDILGAQRTGLRNIWLTAQADTVLNRAFAGQIVPESVAADLRQLPDLIRQMSAEG
jgi:HAD superfamily hydrolase (TIGR01549 family)